jgi:hypothetical protein
VKNNCLTTPTKRFLRYLRIAFSITCVIACVLLIVLWVRSYWHRDVISRMVQDKLATVIGSNWGTVYFTRADYQALNRKSANEQEWKLETLKPNPIDKKVRWFIDSRLILIEIHFPHWFLVLPIAGIAAVPWIRWRFTRRTLLIATTLVAVVLGLIVWMARQ